MSGVFDRENGEKTQHVWVWEFATWPFDFEPDRPYTFSDGWEPFGAVQTDDGPMLMVRRRTKQPVILTAPMGPRPVALPPPEDDDEPDDS